MTSGRKGYNYFECFLTFLWICLCVYMDIPKYTSTVILNFLYSRTVRSEYLFFKPPSLWYFLIAAWAKTDALRNLLYSRHTLLYLHCSVVVLFSLWQSGSVTPAGNATPFFAYWLRCMRSPKGPGSILTFSSMESLLCLIVEADLHLELGHLDQQSIRLWEEETNSLLENQDR